MELTLTAEQLNVIAAIRRIEDLLGGEDLEASRTERIGAALVTVTSDDASRVCWCGVRTKA